MNIDKIKSIAKERFGKEITNEQAAKYVEKYGKLSDDEMDNVSGAYGFCDEEYHYGKYCETCGVWCKHLGSKPNGSGGHIKLQCPVCGTIYE